MVMKPEPIILAVESLLENGRGTLVRRKRRSYFCARRKQFDTKMAKKFSKYDQIVMIAGHYEGVDVRVASFESGACKRMAHMSCRAGNYRSHSARFNFKTN